MRIIDKVASAILQLPAQPQIGAVCADMDVKKSIPDPESTNTSNHKQTGTKVCKSDLASPQLHGQYHFRCI